MDQAALLSLKKWFLGYTGSFTSDDPEYKKNIQLKINHTFSVIQEIQDLARRLQLSQPDQYLAESIALLHDVGRFEQYEHYATFSDYKSENHALLSIKILKEKKVLTEINPADCEIIFQAVSNHNLPLLPVSGDERPVLFARLIRDADKLDIWKIFIEYYLDPDAEENQTLVHGLKDTPGISEPVCTCLVENKIVKNTAVKNLNDLKLLQMGLVYDINFKPSFMQIKNRNYLDTLRSVLPVSDKVDAVLNAVKSFLDQKLI